MVGKLNTDYNNPHPSLDTVRETLQPYFPRNHVQHETAWPRDEAFFRNFSIATADQTQGDLVVSELKFFSTFKSTQTNKFSVDSKAVMITSLAYF